MTYNRAPLSERIYNARMEWADKDAAYHMLESCRADFFAELVVEAHQNGFTAAGSGVSGAERWVRVNSPKWRDYRKRENDARREKNIAWANVARLEALQHEQISTQATNRMMERMQQRDQ